MKEEHQGPVDGNNRMSLMKIIFGEFKLHMSLGGLSSTSV